MEVANSGDFRPVLQRSLNVLNDPFKPCGPEAKHYRISVTTIFE